MKNDARALKVLAGVKKRLSAVKHRFQASVDDAVRQFFRDHPNPDDAQVHDFARSLGMTPEALEGHIYHLFTECNDQVMGKWCQARGCMQTAATSLPTAASLRNFIIKRWGGTPIKSMGFGSVYDSWQDLSLFLKRKSDIPSIVETFESHGWIKQPQHDRNSIRLEFKLGTAWASLVLFHDSGTVKCTGPKKAKRSSLPYYD